jgi:K+-transporting ATPase ATPase C chain
MNKDFIRQSLVGLKIVLVMTVVTGIAYPAAVWGVGQVAFHDNANGQIVAQDGKDRGSAIIGQNFDIKDPRWFHGRPSSSDYDGLASGASNLGPSNPDLLKSIRERQQDIAKAEGVDVSEIPADAVTASGSGLDPYISPAYAALQVDRVARERDLSTSVVRALVEAHTSGRQLGFLGEPKVNVFELNLALERR